MTRALVVVSWGVAALATGCGSAGGNVWAWGSNVVGQLGDGTKTSRTRPVRVAFPHDVAAVAAGYYHSAARATGELFSWGDLFVNGAPIKPASIAFAGVERVSTGFAHAFALRSDGTVWAWGDNSLGQLGDGTKVGRPTPVQVAGLSDIVAIEAGSGHALALRSDGTVWAWGVNNDGQLGIGSNMSQSTPVQIPGLTNVVAISASTGPHPGNQFSMALLADGTLREWGAGPTTSSPVPAPLTGLGNVVRIDAGYRWTMVLLADGTVQAFGFNGVGQLGDGTLISRATPAPVTGLAQVAAIAAAEFHGLVLLRDGTLRAWGRNALGQLGDGTNFDRKLPIVVPGVFDVESISADGEQSFALIKRPRLPDVCALTGSKWTCNGRGPLEELPHCPLQPGGPTPIATIPCPIRPHAPLCALVPCPPCLKDRTCDGQRFDVRFDGRESDLRPVLLDRAGRIVGRTVDLRGGGPFDRHLQFQALPGADYELVVRPGATTPVGVPLELRGEIGG